MVKTRNQAVLEIKKQQALPINSSSIKSKTKLREPWEQTKTKWRAHRRRGEVMGDRVKLIRAANHRGRKRNTGKEREDRSLNIKKDLTCQMM